LRLKKFYVDNELQVNYIKSPNQVVNPNGRPIYIFNIDGKNIDHKVVEEFGEEWNKFYDFSDEMITESGNEYFDIVREDMVNKESYVLDIGCGTGRWTKYLASRAGFIEAVDPSNAIFAADKLLNSVPNVRLTKASIETLPFPDESFDFAMSIGVLHHIPDTQQAMKDCVKKVKKGGYFFVFLYYNFDKRGLLFRSVFFMSNLVRKMVSKLPNKLKKFVCDILAVVLYMPFVLLVRFFRFLGMKKFAEKLPLSSYYNKDFYVFRNDALDRFGTRLEQRFSEKQVKEMMTNAGLTEIIVSEGIPLYHAVGRRN